MPTRVKQEFADGSVSTDYLWPGDLSRIYGWKRGKLNRTILVGCDINDIGTEIFESPDPGEAEKMPGRELTQRVCIDRYKIKQLGHLGIRPITMGSDNGPILITIQHYDLMHSN